MNFHFSEEEIALINALIQTSYACTLGEKELTYGENLENLLFNEEARGKVASELIVDYINQLELEIQFYWTLGFDSMPIISKIILALDTILKERL